MPIRLPSHPPLRLLPAIAALALAASPALAQASMKIGAAPYPAYPAEPPDWLRVIVPDPADPAIKAYAEQAAKRTEAERELARLRARHFGSVRATPLRQAGLLRLREFSDPALFPTLLEVFEREKDDVRLAVLDLFADSATDEGDATLAWVAVFDERETVRDAARQRLTQRVEARGEVPNRVQLVIDHALRRDETPIVNAAAHLAHSLKLLQAIPLLITAQVSVQGTGGGDDSALAWILVGTQQAFVTDVNPIVGTNSVAFDPQIGVITTGSIMRIIDAVAVIYRTEVHQTLVQMTTEASGASTAALAWDIPAWNRWWAEEIKPAIIAAEFPGPMPLETAATSAQPAPEEPHDAPATAHPAASPR